jgi:hypothetical protein
MIKAAPMFNHQGKKERSSVCIAVTTGVGTMTKAAAMIS